MIALVTLDGFVLDATFVTTLAEALAWFAGRGHTHTVESFDGVLLYSN